MPYRIDISSPQPQVVDLLVELGAIDVEPTEDGMAAILPDSVAQDHITDALGDFRVTFSAALGRDSNSVWLVSPHTFRIGDILIGSPDAMATPNTLRFADSDAFGTGHHPTTALCVEELQTMLSLERFDSVLDVGIGSGILALTALMKGVPNAVGLDTDPTALKVAAENAQLNGFADRLRLALGGPETLDGQWPLVVANLLAAPLIDMAPVLVQRLKGRGQLILSGVPSSLEGEVRRAYQHYGVRTLRSKTRCGWVMLIAQASW